MPRRCTAARSIPGIQQQTDYEKNINAFITEGCDLIVTVGFLLADATKAAAEANPAQKFAIVDQTYDPVIPNVHGSSYAVEPVRLPERLPGGGDDQDRQGLHVWRHPIPGSDRLHGWLRNGRQSITTTQHGTAVEVLGWDPATQTGLFAGNFDSTDDGRRLGESLLDEGADIIMPVAGPVGLGTLAVMKERAPAW